jgi:hypothetical protein
VEAKIEAMARLQSEEVAVREAKAQLKVEAAGDANAALVAVGADANYEAKAWLMGEQAAAG